MSVNIIAPERDPDLIWYMDPECLVRRPLSYFPTRYDSIESKLNKILKLAIYCGLVLTVIEGDVSYLLIPVIFAAFSYLLYSEAITAPGVQTAVINPIDPSKEGLENDSKDISKEDLENVYLKGAEAPDYDEGCFKTTEPFYFPSLLNCARNSGKSPEEIVAEYSKAVGPSPLGLPSVIMGPNVPVIHSTLADQGSAYRYVAGQDLWDLKDKTIINKPVELDPLKRN